MVTNSSVNFDGQPKRQVLIMDEVDGMSGGDRGGVMDLIQSIKARHIGAKLRNSSASHLYSDRCTQTSKVPIICICNDAWSQKLRSLKNHCLELVYSRPTKLQIRSRMVGIAAKEGLQVSDNAMEALIENCHSDIRLILNTLQVHRTRIQSDSGSLAHADASPQLRFAFV
jgi:replication factor C subunit 1